MPQEMPQQPTQGPPYPSQEAGPGGLPTVNQDVPELAIFICLYLTAAVSNFGLFQYNRLKKGHFFFPSALLGGFCMARILTCSLRIGWATHQTNVSLAIAAQIFVNAGILIVYIINIMFAQRILRAKQPHIGWNRVLRIFFYVLYALIAVALVLVIVLTVLTFYTLDLAVKSEALWIQRGAITYLLIIAFIPLPIIAVAYALPKSADAETFGYGSISSKTLVLLGGSCLCTIIAGFKAGTLWEDPRPANNPAWYQSKSAFYVFNFTMEILILILYTTSRVDQRFYVPDGSRKRNTYTVPDRRDSEYDTDCTEQDGEKKRCSDIGDALA